jgi:3-oxoacyl-ACP reductase-like protein
MSSQTSQDQDKIDEYIRVIQERILEPIQETEAKQYCTATLLLLFAAIDGMGKLLHHNSRAGSNQRIRRFLEYMGGQICPKTDLKTD